MKTNVVNKYLEVKQCPAIQRNLSENTIHPATLREKRGSKLG
jgi:hypothetical protein